MLLATAPAPCAAQDARDGGGVTLEQALRTALGKHPRVLLGVQQVESETAATVLASAPFDVRLRSTVTTQRDNALLPPSEREGAITSLTTDNQSYGVGVEKLFRSGISVSPEIQVSRTQLEGSAALPLGTASAALRMQVPLLYNRGGLAVRAPEGAAALALEASRDEQFHVYATVARETVVAYWDYVATQRRLEIARRATERARRLVEETEALVRADERPAADLTQLRANVAFKSAAQIDAEQRLIEARHQLGLAMGLAPDVIASLPAATSDLPEVDDTTVGRVADVTTLLQAARGGRADLQAARTRWQAARLSLTGAASALRPRLDLGVEVGYVGLAQRQGVDGFFAPLHRNVRGTNASVHLSYQVSVMNAEAQGRSQLLAAQVAQREIATRDLENRIASAVTLAVQALHRASASLRDSRQATALYQEAVANERSRFRLGTATLFDVLQAEELSTNAQLAELSGRRAYAVAVVELRFVTGELVELVDMGARLKPGALEIGR